MLRQRVLSIENKFISALIERRSFHSDSHVIRNVNECIKKHGRFVDREWAEKNSSVKQIVACGVITNREKVLCLRRSARSNRPELRLNWTLMFGGHVEEEDITADDPLLNCVIREINEEIGLKPQSTPLFLGYVTDPATSVGQFHIGAVYRFESIKRVFRFSKNLDNYEFVNARSRSQIRFCEPSFVVGLVKSHRLDPWSEIFVKSGNAVSHHPISNYSQMQLEFPLLWK